MLSAKELYKRSLNLRHNVKDGRITLANAVDRLFDLLSKSKNPHVKIYVDDWDDFVPIKTRTYFIKKIKKGLPTLAEREYYFDTHELDMSDEHAKKVAKVTVDNAHKDLEVLSKMKSTLAQHSAPSGRYEPASYKGLDLIIYNLKNEIQNEK